jgi:release factor glutamine methyltransferase
MTAGELYRNYLKLLSPLYDEGESSTITAMIFENIANCSKIDIITNPSKILDTQIKNKLSVCLEELLQHKPIQYVLGEAIFYKLKFEVDESVLIPRPETEELVTEVIQFAKTKNQLFILDVGTGSGCISIAIKKNVPHCLMTSVDISKQSIETAKKNALFHKVDINFVELDFLNTENQIQLEMYDVIVSNPPYIPISQKAEMEKHVTDFEPNNALFVSDENPLIFYKAIVEFCRTHLKQEGNIFLEIHELFGEAVQELFHQHKFETKLIKDMYGKDRVVVASRFH